MADEIVTKTRDEVREDYLRSYRIRNPDASTGDGTQPHLHASVFADQMAPMYANAKTLGNNIPLKSKAGDALDERGDELGVQREGASGASGSVTITASASGGTIFEEDELTEPNTQLRYECAVTNLYTDGQPVPIRAKDTGPATNLPAGTILQWSAPRPGIGPNATVIEQSDGSGLSGGREREDDDAYRDRLEERQANPPASGNEAEYIAELERTPGLQVQKAFAFPAILGPGTCGITFTLRPERPGGNRRPNSTQLTDAYYNLVGKFPGDDGILKIELLQQNVDVTLDVDWTEGAEGWADSVPWPPRYASAGAPGSVIIASVVDALQFTVGTDDADYTGVPQPVVGQTLAVYNKTAGKFSRKQILSFTGTGPWLVTCDTTNNVTDAVYTPAVGQRVCPWSDSLDDLVAPIASYFDNVGPGEQLGAFFDAGRRQRRVPASPKFWPHVVTNKLISPVLDLPVIQDAEVVEGLDTTTTIGTPGMTAYLMELRYLAAFPS